MRLENPLVVRFVRAGFRRGKGSFRLLVLTTIFALIVLGNVSLYVSESFFPGRVFASFESFSRALFYQIYGFNSLNLVILGGLRIYGTAMREKMEGQLELLRVSGMPPGSIVLGTILGLQVPGYLLFVVSLPLSAFCWLGGGVSARMFALSHIYLLGLTTLVSVMALYMALRMEKRGADAIIGLAVIFLIFGGQIPFAGGFGPFQFLVILHPVTLFLSLIEPWGWMVQGGAVAPLGGPGGFVFYGTPIEPVYIALALYAFLTAFLWTRLARILLLEERHRPSIFWSLVFYAGLLFFVQGVIPSVTLGLAPMARAGCLFVSLVVLFYLAAARLPHGEHYLLSRSFEGSGDPVHPFRALARDLVPLGAVHVIFDCILLGIMGARLDPLTSLASLIPVAALLTLGVGLELGTTRERGKRVRGLFWLALLLPLAGTAVAAALSRGEAVWMSVMAVSPFAPGPFLALREELGASLLPALVLGAVVSLALGGAGVLAGQGHYRILEQQAALMREGRAESFEPAGGL